MAIPKLDMKNLSVDDVMECLETSGYIIDKKEFSFARDDGAFKYNGYGNNQHRFLIGFESDDKQDEFYITKVFVGLGPSGELCADYGGTFVFEGSYDDALAYVERTCN